MVGREPTTLEPVNRDPIAHPAQGLTILNGLAFGIGQRRNGRVQMAAIAAPRQTKKISLPGMDSQTSVWKVAKLVRRKIHYGDRLLEL